MSDDVFFIGWQGRTGRKLGQFLAAIILGALALTALLAVALAAAVDDPGDGGYKWTSGPRTVRGVVTTDPYPILRMAPDATHPKGHALLLSGEGKNGAPLAAGSEGRVVETTGFLIRRGDIDMLQIDEPPTLVPDAAPVAPTPPESLGRWRITGEICDGKCYAGAMRPGGGLAHRACASLCLFGGVPPILVSTGPLEGSDFLLLAGADGKALPDSFRDDVAVRLELEGEVERRGDLLVFRTDVGKARRP